MRITSEKELLDLIERGCPTGAVLKRQRRARELGQPGMFLRRAAGPAFAVCCAAYLSVVVTGNPHHPRHDTASSTAPYHAGDDGGQALQQVEAASQPAAQSSMQPVTAVTPVRQSMLAKLTRSRVQDMKLVGISWSDDPDALIEDTATRTTFFLKKGQTIEGGILVKDIYKDKVILEFHGRQVELQ